MLGISLLLATTLITRTSGQIEGLILDDTEEDLASFERKAGLMMREVPIRNVIPHEGIKRFKCHACEPPTCEDTATGTQICLNAVQCWKSRVREGK